MPRPSSPVGTKAFTVRPYLLHHIAKAVTTSTIPQSPFVTYCIVSLLGMHVYLVFCSCCSTTHFVGKRLLLSNRFLCHADVNFRFPSIIDLLVGLTGLEPVTPRLSSACSNQLSYRPGFGSLSRNWWRHGDSNPGHPACKAGALPTELYPQLRFSVKKVVTHVVPGFAPGVWLFTHLWFVAGPRGFRSLSPREEIRPVHFRALAP